MSDKKMFEMLRPKTETNQHTVLIGLVLISTLCVSHVNGAVDESGADQTEAVFKNWPLAVEVQHRPSTHATDEPSSLCLKLLIIKRITRTYASVG